MTITVIREQNLIFHFGEPSLLVRLRHDAAGTPFEERCDVDHEVLKGHGGSIPIRANPTCWITRSQPKPCGGTSPRDSCRVYIPA